MAHHEVVERGDIPLDEPFREIGMDATGAGNDIAVLSVGQAWTSLGTDRVEKDNAGLFQAAFDDLGYRRLSVSMITGLRLSTLMLRSVSFSGSEAEGRRAGPRFRGARSTA